MTTQKRTAEQVRAGHPDKLCDQIADAILDRLLASADGASNRSVRWCRSGIEVLAKGNTLVLAGEVRTDAETVDYAAVAREVWAEVGYDGADQLQVIDLVGEQQPELQANSDRLGAGDQGVMVGYATPETATMMPLEFVCATDICRELDARLRAPDFPWLRPDGKAQVTIGESGRIEALVVEAQHSNEVGGRGVTFHQAEIRAQILHDILIPMFGDAIVDAQLVVNGAGSFAIGGPTGDAGVVGRKIVCDAYGPRVPVGGGAFSGKDPTKVDRTGAYAARYIARRAVNEGATGGEAVTVTLAYAIGGAQPDMVTAVTESGRNISRWVKQTYPDLSPEWIAGELNLWRERPADWTYLDVARHGHFGYPRLPWEQS